MVRSLTDAIAAVERESRTLTVYAPAPVEELREQFATRNVTVVHRHLPDTNSDGFVVVTDDGTFRGAVSLPVLLSLLEPPVRLPWTTDPSAEPFRAAFDFMENTVFTAYDRRQMLAVAREIEDRAWRVGTGTLHAGFQSATALSAQRAVYERLATRLDVHVYYRSGWEVTDLAAPTVHRVDRDEIGRVWFVVFDGGDRATNACALVAEERAPGTFYGFWTYEPARVAALADYLDATYR